MISQKVLMITGATGLVGGLLTMTALRAGHSVRLLARSRQNRSPGERIQHVLASLGFSSGEWNEQASKIDIYEGDMALPRFGLSERKWQRMGEGLSGIYHAAAYIGFRKNQRSPSLLGNVDGTRHVLELAESSRAHLFHISTAYVAGDTKGRVFEKDMETHPPSRNPYEETKFLAEREVHLTCRRKGLTYTVFRPAILIGDSIHGRTIRFNSIYYFMKLFHYASKQRQNAPVVLKAKPEATLNIIPVDFAVKAIWDLSELAGSAGKIFHITNPSPPPFQELIAVAEAIFNLSIECSGPASSPHTPSRGPKTERETSLSLYAPYMAGEPEFDLTNTRSLLPGYDAAFPALDAAYFAKILAYAIDHHWKEPSPSAARLSHEKTGTSFAHKYFNEFLAGKVNRPLLQNIKEVSAVFSIEIQDDVRSRWVLELRGGRLLSISQNGSTPECSYVLDGATFEKIARGLCPPDEAFFEGRVDIRGNIETGLHVAAAFSEFCKTFPYEDKTTSP
jgi:nucleoside-diphosphate-sugar epimerase/predicted lipid carrier protein YhbT